MQILTWPSLYWKSLDLKNLNKEKKSYGLETKDNLDKIQKLVSTVETSTLNLNVYNFDDWMGNNTEN